MLRQQTTKPAGRGNRCLADYVAPVGDHLGGFAVAIHGAEELAASYEAEGDDYQSIMVKALADRLAEVFAEYTHLLARQDWYEPDADRAVADLLAEQFAGIRPAFGYPACPDHSQKQTLFGLLNATQLGMTLTESCAMTPAASVSGLLFAHPSCDTSASDASARTRPWTMPAGKGSSSPRPNAGCVPTSPTTLSDLARRDLGRPGSRGAVIRRSLGREVSQMELAQGQIEGVSRAGDSEVEQQVRSLASNPLRYS